MTKKIIIISSLAIATLALIIIANFMNAQNKVKSTITLDINPSIKIELNKHNKVVQVTALNNDAKKIVNQAKGSKSLSATIDNLTESLAKSKFISNNEINILLHTSGTISDDQVAQLIISSFKKNKINPNIIVQESTTNSAINAKKYNITEGKAAYIEKIIEDNKALNFSDLKDKSINDLISIINGTYKEEVTQDENNSEEQKEEYNNQDEKKSENNIQQNVNIVNPVTPPKKEEVDEQKSEEEQSIEEEQKENNQTIPEEPKKEITPVTPPEEEKQTEEENEPEEQSKQEETNIEASVENTVIEKTEDE